VLEKQKFNGISIFSFTGPYKGPIKLIGANLIKDYPKMQQTKLSDHPSISSVEEDVLRFFFYF
jgi:hypothetical protein